MRCRRMLLLGFVLAAAGAGFLPMPVNASFSLPIVTDHLSDGVRELQVIFPAQGKTLEYFRPGASRAFKKQSYDSGGRLIAEENFDENGRLVSDFKLEADMSQHWRHFDEKTGKLAVETRQLDSGKFVETRYRQDGETVWTVSESDGDGHTSAVRYIAPDGKSLVRRFGDAEMTVDTFNKEREFIYGQRWIADGKDYRLAEVRLGNGRQRRIVVLKEDGVTIDHVDYQISGFAGWSTLKSEPGDKLTEPVDPHALQELNPEDDPSAPDSEN